MTVWTNGTKRDPVVLECQHLRAWGRSLEEYQGKTKEVHQVLGGENSSKKPTWLLKPIPTIKRYEKQFSLYEVVLSGDINSSLTPERANG
ncbi:hypothetical protein BTUL_0019g00210 [Botrytis tulipae]|uniref:Uncharacterized protein n=1 Tax=Botrytis tulipae TaxID=87230 RepID=A0A4Z1F6X9_9HELO|nr:hypothetical protein BTUL_0019g00210 [Botrytis tulipae]